MPKSTLVFAGLAIFFAVTTAAVGWRVLSSPDANVPLVGGASLELGLPGSEDFEEAQGKQAFLAASALIWDTETQQIQFEQNGFERHPIASITKLMTAMVALDHGIDWDKEVTILPEEQVQGGRLLVFEDETATMRDLFHASLVGSANNATLAYVRGLDVAVEEFVLEMNRKAIALGLEQTEFTDVTGLDVGNISTAYEVARIAETAFRDYPEIAQATSLSEYVFTAGGSGRVHEIKNSNKLVSEQGMEVTGGKTGYLYEARYCLVAQGVDKAKTKIAVILGSPSEVENFTDIKRLLTSATP